VPGGGSIRQAVLDHDPHGDGDHAVRVVAIGHRQIQHVGVEVMIAVAAAMLRIADVQIAWPAAHRVAQIVQGPVGRPQTIRRLSALGAGAA